MNLQSYNNIYNYSWLGITLVSDKKNLYNYNPLYGNILKLVKKEKNNMLLEKLIKILVYTFCYNEIKILPFIIDYWKKYAYKVVVYDNGSTDGSIELLSKYDWIEVRHYETNGKFDPNKIQEIKNICYKETNNSKIDYIMVCDLDEVLLYGDKLLETLLDLKMRKFDVIKAQYYDVLKVDFPIYENKLIQEYDDIRLIDVNISKPILFSPTIDIEFSNYQTSFLIKNNNVLLYSLPVLHLKMVGLFRFYKLQKLLYSSTKYSLAYGYNKDTALQKFNNSNAISYKKKISIKDICKEVGEYHPDTIIKLEEKEININSINQENKEKETDIKCVNHEINNTILICIFNYRHDENAKRWLHLLSPYFKTVVLDSGNDHEEKEFVLYPNIYYSGLWNEMKKLSEQGNYKYIGLICSDVTINDENALKLISKLYNLLITNKIGIWQPSADNNSRKNWTVLVNNQYNFTFPSIIEGWMHFIHKDIVDSMDYIDTTLNLYGYGIDIVESLRSKEQNKLLVIDNTILVTNPAGTGYNSKIALQQGDTYLKKIYNNRIYNYTGKYHVTYSNTCDDLYTDITFVVPYRDRDEMKPYFENNIKTYFNKYTYKILYINQTNLKLFRPGLLRNIGARFSNSRYIIIQDIDIMHLREVDIDKIYNEYKHPLRLYNQVSQLLVSNNFKYIITKTEKREGTSGCMLFSYDDWYKFNGFSNLFRGWGSEDDAFREYILIKTLPQNIGHITHIRNINKNPEATKLNSKIYFDNIVTNKIKHMADGWRQQVFDIKNIKEISNNIFEIGISNIGVIYNYEYKSIYKQYDKLDLQMKCIYTCITGNYDILRTPTVKSPGWDYICFTDQNIKSDFWEIRDLPKDLQKYSLVKLLRLIKILSYKYLPEYDLVIWIDANVIQTNINIDTFINDVLTKNISFKTHPVRDCIYDECDACAKYKKETYDNANNLKLRYLNEGMPKHYGMYETNVFIRNHHDKEIQTLMNMWANELIHNSHRDLLSLNYCIWKLNMKDKIDSYSIDTLKKYFTLELHKKIK